MVIVSYLVYAFLDANGIMNTTIPPALTRRRRPVHGGKGRLS